MYIELTAVPVNQMDNKGSSGPVYVVQATQQSVGQILQAQGASVPTSAQNNTMEQLAVAATHIVDAGRRSERVSFLQIFGVHALGAYTEYSFL